MLAERVTEWTTQWQQEGMAQLLQKQLAMRFGSLPDEVVARLHNASSEELERWSLRIFDRPSLRDIFQ